MTTKSRYTPKRQEFLEDLFTTAIENGGYGPFTVHAYEGEGWDSVALIRFVDEDDETDKLVVTPKVMADGLKVVADAVTRVDPRHPDDGDLDVIDALAVLECALLGAVTYA